MTFPSTLQPRKLTEEETFCSFTNWQRNILYCLNQNEANTPYLLPTSADVTWLKLTPTNATRGFQDDEDGTTKEVKVHNLHLMLGYLAQLVPHYLSTEIIEESTSITSVWDTIRSYYGLQQNERNFMRFLDIKWEGQGVERPETLFRRIKSHLQDNLLTSGSKLQHDESVIAMDEVLSPTVERLAVLRWMELLHPKLPALVARTFAYDLQRRTLKDIQPQIVDCLVGLLDQIHRDELQASHALHLQQHLDSREPRTRPAQTQTQLRQITASKPPVKPISYPHPPSTVTRVSTASAPPKVHTSKSFILRSATEQIVLPGEYIEAAGPPDLDDNTPVAIEPRTDDDLRQYFSPIVTNAVARMVRIPYHMTTPTIIKKHQHIAQLHYIKTAEECLSSSPSVKVRSCKVTSKPQQRQALDPHSAAIELDPSYQLSLAEKKCFLQLHLRYDNVFNPRIGTYNDASGKLRANINMGPNEPPSQKAFLPSYNPEKLELLQTKMDELEDLGVLADPESLGISVTHTSPSFLIKKADGGHRLVTNFNLMASYAKRSPSKPSSTDDILRFLSRHKYIIKTDMTKQFFQLLMKKSCLKYLGVLTPHKGVRVYTRAAMGMPGSTEHLDELMCRVLGDLMHEGIVKKIADDLYTGGNTIPELLRNWERILQCFEVNNLRLSASKTVICPTTTTILGWEWTGDKIKASPLKINPLASSPPPKTVKTLRSWLGAFKHLHTCISDCSSILSELEAATAGKTSQAMIEWTDALINSFIKAQKSLQNLECITIPRPNDPLLIKCEHSSSTDCIAATLYTRRNTSMLICGNFSAKLKPHQKKWLPCEIEALTISSAAKHWAPVLKESRHPAQVLTCSQPCVKAYNKLCKGEFSSSARISTFLTTLSQYQLTVKYAPGKPDIPVICAGQSCKICQFVSDREPSTVYKLSVHDVTDKATYLPLTSPHAWKTAQHDCPCLRRTYQHLLQGTRPTKISAYANDLRPYLQTCAIGKYGLLVCREKITSINGLPRDLTVVPRHAVPGLLRALHTQLQHPTPAEMAKFFTSRFFALDIDHEIQRVHAQCLQCAPKSSCSTSKGATVHQYGPHPSYHSDSDDDFVPFPKPINRKCTPTNESHESSDNISTDIPTQPSLERNIECNPLETNTTATPENENGDRYSTTESNITASQPSSQVNQPIPDVVTPKFSASPHNANSDGDSTIDDTDTASKYPQVTEPESHESHRPQSECAPRRPVDAPTHRPRRDRQMPKHLKDFFVYK